jgi:hypothetical protein
MPGASGGVAVVVPAGRLRTRGLGGDRRVSQFLVFDQRQFSQFTSPAENDSGAHPERAREGLDTCAALSQNLACRVIPDHAFGRRKIDRASAGYARPLPRGFVDGRAARIAQSLTGRSYPHSSPKRSHART